MQFKTHDDCVCAYVPVCTEGNAAALDNVSSSGGPVHPQ